MQENHFLGINNYKHTIRSCPTKDEYHLTMLTRGDISCLFITSRTILIIISTKYFQNYRETREFDFLRNFLNKLLDRKRLPYLKLTFTANRLWTEHRSTANNWTHFFFAKNFKICWFIWQTSLVLFWNLGFAVRISALCALTLQFVYK